jgi:hypothetical protein
MNSINAQQVTNTINFTADISGILGIGIGNAFDPNQDSLLVMGLDWDGLGQNVIGNRTMTQDPFNPGIFTTTLTVTSGPNTTGEGDSTKWKYKAYPDNRFSNGGWELGGDRWIIYQPDGSVIDLPVIIPRIYPLMDPITNNVDITFYVDMNNALDYRMGVPIPPNEIQFVGMRGDTDWLGNWWLGGCWCPDDTLDGKMKVLTHFGNNIWARTVTVSAGTPGGFFEYKFGCMWNGIDTTVANYMDNENGYGVNHILFLTNGTPFTIVDTFGVIGSTHIVPVELSSFTASLNNYTVLLNWTTETELNNLGFEIERKILKEKSHGDWITIGFIEGQGTTTEPQFYSFSDDIGSLSASSLIYRLKQVDYNGSFEYSEEVTVENSTLPDKYALSQNYPNPFNPSTKISWQSPVGSWQTLTIYDLLGNKVETLIDEYKSAGKYEVEWDASEFTSGVYIYKIIAGSFTQTRKMILMK